LSGGSHLDQCGESVHRPESIRHAALRAASKDYSTLRILRRLNLIRNYQAVPQNKEIFSRDVEYLKKLYRSDYRKGHHSKISQRRTKKQTGGDPLTSENSEEIETKAKNNPLIIDNKVVINKQKICKDENCNIKNTIYESHIVNGNKIVYQTLDEKDAKEILELDKKYLDSDADIEYVDRKISDNQGYLIGIKADDHLQGYCQYEPRDNQVVFITWFCANKGYGTPLYTFMEKYFKANDYKKIILVVNLEGSYSTARINFWYKMGFKTYESVPEKYKVHMEKHL